MKRAIKITIILTLLFFSISCVSRKPVAEEVKAINKKVQSKDYTIKVSYANPTRGKQIYLNSDYELKIKNDSAFAYLPYYGVAHIAPLNPAEGGIKFAEPMTDYVLTPNKKNDGWDVRFKVRAKEYNYEFTATIFSNGNSSFTVTSSQRDPISFSGYVE